MFLKRAQCFAPQISLSRPESEGTSSDALSRHTHLRESRAALAAPSRCSQAVGSDLPDSGGDCHDLRWSQAHSAKLLKQSPFRNGRLHRRLRSHPYCLLRHAAQASYLWHRSASDWSVQRHKLTPECLSSRDKW